MIFLKMIEKLIYFNEDFLLQKRTIIYIYIYSLYSKVNYNNYSQLSIIFV
jgi:hypothetical protein